MSDESSDGVFAPFRRADCFTRGELVDTSGAARGVGIGIPVAMTAAAWAALGAHDGGVRVMEALRVSLGFVSGDHVDRVHFTQRGVRGAWLEASAVIGPGDDGRPVLTVLLASED